MAITELGACEWFVWDLRRSNLIDRGQLDQVVGEFLKKQPRAEPPALAEYLVGQGILSAFQSERLLQGKTQGLVLGPYTLVDALGSGSMGTVYKAVSKNDGQSYAVKVLPRRSMWNVRIARRQVRAFEQCKHPAVVPFVDVGTAGGTHYLAWPLIEGETLDTVVARDGPLSAGLTAQYLCQAAEGLDVCHQQGIIHGMLKPSNLSIGKDQRLRILDFGIGSLLAESDGESLVDTMSTANSLTSGLDCASPESILEPSNRTTAGDQYSLGCVLYFCLTGRYPFPEGTAVQKMMAHQAQQPPPIRETSPNVPEALVEIVTRLMQKAPEARFGSMAEVIEALRPFAEASPSPRPARPSANAAETGSTIGRRAVLPARKAVAPPAAEAPARPVAPLPAPPKRAAMLAPVAAASATAEEEWTEPTSPPKPFEEEAPASRSLEESLGPVGLVSGALLVGALLCLFWQFLHH
ncbi:MAG TPA: serine/threonine-protein kinase [Gemmataceae bacterium]|jgi:serine/threonine-protein kinase|nr:serine/threonine-protein kinase [Gemmataceae bacterium]